MPLPFNVFLPRGTGRHFLPDLFGVSTVDLREHFEERAGILEFDAGLPSPEAEPGAYTDDRRHCRDRNNLTLASFPSLFARPRGMKRGVARRGERF
jgi:hypothetical protein